MANAGSIVLAPLAAHRECIGTLVGWFEAAWPEWYGPDGPGWAPSDLDAYANEGSLPVGVVAFKDGRLCGVAALKAGSLDSHAHLTPWAGAGLVDPALRGQGIGRLLLGALAEQARALGFPAVYCGTATARSLLERDGWELIDEAPHPDGAPGTIGIYRRLLP